MNEDGRFIPPGPGRSAAFAAAGGFGRSPLFTSGCGLFFAAIAAYFLKNIFFSGLIEAFRDGINSAALQNLPPVNAFGDYAGFLVRPSAFLFLAITTGVLIGALLPSLAARRGKGATAVPLPKIPQARMSIGAIRFFGTCVFIVTVLLSIRQTRIESFSPEGWIGAFGRIGLQCILALGLILMLTGAAEILILRHQMFRALFLNRSEFKREMRSQEGNPEAAAQGRRRLRQDDPR